MNFYIKFYLILLSQYLTKTMSFNWRLTDNIPASKILSFSERYMFADNNGPDILDNGDSYISVSGLVSAYMSEGQNHSVDVAYAVFAAAENHHHDSLTGMCGMDGDISENSWATNLELITVPTQYMGTYDIDMPDIGLNGTYHQWDAVLEEKYIVKEESWHNVAFQVCTDSESMPVASLDSLVTFKVLFNHRNKQYNLL